jgi:hypothetical protein
MPRKPARQKRRDEELKALEAFLASKRGEAAEFGLRSRDDDEHRYLFHWAYMLGRKSAGSPRTEIHMELLENFRLFLRLGRQALEDGDIEDLERTVELAFVPDEELPEDGLDDVHRGWIEMGIWWSKRWFKLSNARLRSKGIRVVREALEMAFP